MELLVVHSIEARAQSGKLDVHSGTILPVRRVVIEKTAAAVGLFGTTRHGPTALYRYAKGLWLQNELLRLRLPAEMQAGIVRRGDTNVLTLSLDGRLLLAVEYVRPRTGIDFGLVTAQVINDPHRFRTFFAKAC